MHSVFASVLGTNHVPTPTELGQLKVLLVDAQWELFLVESEIDWHVHWAVPENLLIEKQKIEKFIDAHRALMSPIRRMPVEILAEIFVHCLPTDPVYAVRDVYQAPLLLITICREWRQVALDNPRLWNSLH
ncbi:hypothetical protein GYMLUDRAFT_139428, partial [Collybiopsis luxurians FD-317 M1]